MFGVPQIIYLALVVCVIILMQVRVLWEVYTLGFIEINFKSWPDLVLTAMSPFPFGSAQLLMTGFLHLLCHLLDGLSPVRFHKQPRAYLSIPKHSAMGIRAGFMPLTAV